MTGIARPLISCIVPAFNGERYLHEALDSIVAQTYRPLEIIVADDGSTDPTAEIVAAYANQVRYLYQKNAGTASACKMGLKAARGEFIAFLAVDDLWRPEKLARQIARFQLRSDLDVCVCYVQNFWIPELREEDERFRNHRISQLSLVMCHRRSWHAAPCLKQSATLTLRCVMQIRRMVSARH